MEATSPTRRAIGIVRVSPDHDRGGDTQHSPEEQRDSIRRYCAEQGWKLLATLDEVDVSGGWALERRTGLLPAVEAVEAREADVVLVSRFDRLVRSMRVQTEITERVEQAGGDLYAIDSGYVTNGGASAKMTSQFLGAVSEYHRNTTRERTREARVRAIANGIPLTPGAPPGYLRPIIGTRPSGTDIHGPLVRDPELAPVVAEAFAMRAGGATVKDVRAHLAGHGIQMTTGGVQQLLCSRTFLGELHAGDLVNVAAHEAIVPLDVWRRVQNVKVPRGRKAKSERLLARLGVLHCASCGSRMTIGQSHGGKYHTYRCPDTGDCDARASISAELVERHVWGRVVELAAGQEGRASAEDHARAIVAARDRAQDTLDAYLAIVDPLEPAAADRVRDLTAARDTAQAEVDALPPGGIIETVDAASPDLSLHARRDLVRTYIADVTVAPGRGVGRVTVKPIGE